MSDMPTTSVRRLTELLADRTAVALTGAGCSTESGIPDYRGPDGRLRAGSPMLYQEFVRDPAARARYWSRSLVGWPRIAHARPNAAHRALARLEAAGELSGVITQNVDGLHAAAGSHRVVELHGSLAWVRCLGCGVEVSRAAVQRRLVALNPEWRSAAPSASDRPPGPDRGPVPRVTDAGGCAAPAAPDGDARLPARTAERFRVPGCERCGGILKPDVVFFGENVPRRRVETAWGVYREARVLLVVGSSLTVYSGFRFVRQAAREGRPVAIVNLGVTRGDELAAVRVDARAGEALPALADRLLCAVRRRRPRYSPRS